MQERLLYQTFEVHGPDDAVATGKRIHLDLSGIQIVMRSDVEQYHTDVGRRVARSSEWTFSSVLGSKRSSTAQGTVGFTPSSFQRSTSGFCLSPLSHKP